MRCDPAWTVQVRIRRKERVPSWDEKKRKIGSWALVTFVDGPTSAGASKTALQGLQDAVSWNGEVKYGVRGELHCTLQLKQAELNIAEDVLPGGQDPLTSPSFGGKQVRCWPLLQPVLQLTVAGLRLWGCPILCPLTLLSKSKLL